MNINFDQDTKLQEIQNDFSAAFPYLKLVFAVPAKGGGTSSKIAAPGNNYHLTVGDISGNIAPGYVTINDDVTVLELEKLFSQMFGVPVRLQRKSGNIWMETSLTNSWTLHQQNEHAREISRSRIF
ncbi:MAG TPA: hypothetical protein VG738_00235 [Chitinophagaceae bacterium]|nr:hypothetical protein [Chitinophagaceae bacterium]